MSKTYQRINLKDQADKGKKRLKQAIQDHSTKAALTQFKQTGNIGYQELS
jgi:tryptophanyl-tRNA synthetase